MLVPDAGSAIEYGFERRSIVGKGIVRFSVRHERGPV